MSVGVEGPIETAGWGPFALFGERKRRIEREKARVAEVTALGADGDSPRPQAAQPAAEPQTSADTAWTVETALLHQIKDSVRQARANATTHVPANLQRHAPATNYEDALMRAVRLGMDAQFHSFKTPLTNVTALDVIAQFAKGPSSHWKAAPAQKPLPFDEFTDADIVPAVDVSRCYAWVALHNHHELTLIDGLDTSLWSTEHPDLKNDDSADADR